MCDSIYYGQERDWKCERTGDSHEGQHHATKNGKLYVSWTDADIEAALINKFAKTLGANIAIKIEDDHWECGGCGCSHWTEAGAKECNHGPTRPGMFARMDYAVKYNY